MDGVAEVRARFLARPWASVPDADMAAALAVPTMLSDEEGRLYHWLGRAVQGDGATVDLGAFAGGSAARLLSGLALSGRAHRLSAYDHFTASATVRARFLPTEPDGRDILPLARRYLTPWGDRVTLHPGDIRDMRWTGGEVEILAADAAGGTEAVGRRPRRLARSGYRRIAMLEVIRCDMFPAKYSPILFGLILSGLMSLIVSGLSTARAVGLVDGFAGLWMGNWAISWAIAFPTVLVVAPLARRIVARLVRQG